MCVQNSVKVIGSCVFKLGLRPKLLCVQYRDKAAGSSVYKIGLRRIAH
jgi:hypothetical protein